MERQALQAELELRKLSQRATSSEAREKFREAARLRRAADDYLTRILSGKSSTAKPPSGQPFLDSEPEAS